MLHNIQWVNGSDLFAKVGCPIPFSFPPSLPSSPPSHPINTDRGLRERCELPSGFGQSDRQTLYFELKFILLLTQIKNQPLTCVTTGIMNWHCTQISKSSTELLILLKLKMPYHYGSPLIKSWCVEAQRHPTIAAYDTIAALVVYPHCAGLNDRTSTCENTHTHTHCFYDRESAIFLSTWNAKYRQCFLYNRLRQSH